VLSQEGRNAIVITWDEDEFSTNETGHRCCGADPAAAMWSRS
jgi:hypothetical protein